MILVTGPSSLVEDRWIAALNRPERGTIALVASPASGAFWLPTSQLLEALGKRRQEPGARSDDEAILGVWLDAYGVRDVILHHAEVLDTDTLPALDAAIQAAGARLWAVVDPVFVGLAVELLADGTTDRRSWATFEEEWERMPHADLPGPSEPPVPLRAETAWHAEYERLAGLGRKAAMDAPYLVGFCAAAGWARERYPRRTTVAGRLRGLLSTFRDPACLASAARGASVALREVGWEVRIDLRRIAGEPSPSPHHLPPIRLEHLRWFRKPLTVAACVLAGLELPAYEALQVRIGDVEADGSALHMRRDAVPVPAVARPFLRAQLVSRRRQGARPTDYFLADASGPASPRWFISTVLAVLEEIGTSLEPATLDALPSEDERWLNAAGVSFDWLTRGERQLRHPTGWRPDEIGQQVLRRLQAVPGEPAAPCACLESHCPPTPADTPTWPKPRTYVPTDAARRGISALFDRR